MTWTFQSVLCNKQPCYLETGNNLLETEGWTSPPMNKNTGLLKEYAIQHCIGWKKKEGKTGKYWEAAAQRKVWPTGRYGCRDQVPDNVEIRKLVRMRMWNSRDCPAIPRKWPRNWPNPKLNLYPQEETDVIQSCTLRLKRYNMSRDSMLLQIWVYIFICWLVPHLNLPPYKENKNLHIAKLANHLETKVVYYLREEFSWQIAYSKIS